MEEGYLENFTEVTPVFLEYEPGYEAAPEVYSLLNSWEQMESRDRKACERVYNSTHMSNRPTRRSNAADMIIAVNKLLNTTQNLVLTNCDWMDNLPLSTTMPADCGRGTFCENPRLNCSLSTNKSDHEAYVSATMLECRDQLMPEKCRLRVSQTILIIVSIANAAKIVCMLLTIFDDAPALITIGDFIQSLLLNPDKSVPNAIIAGQTNLPGLWRNDRDLTPILQEMAQSKSRKKKALRWSTLRYCRLESISTRQWAFSTSWYSLWSCVLSPQVLTLTTLASVCAA